MLEIKKDKIANIIVMFLGGSVIGWIWEVIWTFYIYGIFANRGVLHGPWLPIYGIGFLIIVLLKKYVGKKPLLLFVASITVCGGLEFFLPFIIK